MNAPAPRTRRALGYAAAAAAFAALFAKQLRFINTHTVNVLFFDQWGFYYPLFHGQGWWETFDRRHGPHRQGVGLVLTRLIADLGGWNSRWDAFAVSVALLASAVLALVLVRRCGNRAGWAAAIALPALFFNVHQFEAFVGASNLSHGAMPILMLLAFCLAWFIRSPALRLASLSALTFLEVFTGFGAFVGAIAPVLFAAELVQALRSADRRRAALAGAALAVTVASWALFLHGYVFDPAQADFRFPYEKPIAYPLFVARMLANFYGYASAGWGPLLLGFAVAAFLLAVLAGRGWQLLLHGPQDNPRGTAIAVLAAFELAYAGSSAIGRVMAGETAPLASRYVTLLIPAALVAVLELAALPNRRAAFWSCLVFAAAVAPGCLTLRQRELDDIEWYRKTRAAWKIAYLRTHDQHQADKVAQFGMYPDNLSFELSFLERNHLNLFLGAADPAADAKP